MHRDLAGAMWGVGTVLHRHGWRQTNFVAKHSDEPFYAFDHNYGTLTITLTCVPTNPQPKPQPGPFPRAIRNYDVRICKKCGGRRNYCECFAT